MKKIVSFSGGRTSAYLCYLMIIKYGRENVDFIYMDTGAEHPKTYEFIKEVDRHFGLNLTCLRLKLNKELGKGNGYQIIDIDDLKPDLKPFIDTMSKYGVPYIGGMFCTDRMKLTPYKKYCDDTYGKKNYETWLGIREDEKRRAKDKEGIRYLCEISDFDKQDVLKWWSEQDFDLGIEEWNGNCVFCPKKSNLKLALAQRENPEEYIKFKSALHDESVRVDNNTGTRAVMYRGNQSLENLIAMFDTNTDKEIKERMRGSKVIDTNSCSESCEMFQLDWIED